MPSRTGLRGRACAATVTLTLLATASGCGGSDEPSSSAYYSAINGFCGTVAAAAKQVSKDTTAVREDTSAAASKRFAVITRSLTRFADSIETALEDLEQTGVPDSFGAYQKGTSAGFRTFIATLRRTAKQSEKDPRVLTKLESRLNAVKLPEPPKEITANARACADFSRP